MANKIQIKRGQSANFSTVTLAAGEPAFTLDDQKLYIGDGTDKVLINPDVADEAIKAQQLKTAQNISATGDITAPAISFNGTAGITLNTTLKEVGTAGTYYKVTTDAKGRVTSGAASLTAADIPSLPNTKITGLGSAAAKDVGTASGNVVAVENNGKINSDVIPEITSINASAITGTIDIENLPKSAIERCLLVENQTARLALTTADVQNGDTVKEIDTGLMFFVVDDTKLSTEAGYEPYTVGSASSVPWSGVTGKPTTLSGYGITDAEPKITTKKTAFNQNFGTAASLKMDGTAAAGTSSDIARIDHVHPTDTSRAASVHTHTKSQITDFPASMPANGGNSDTVDHYHVDDTKTGADTTTNNAIWTANKIKGLLDAKAPLASPAFTGNPTAATQAAADNSTKLATTAFVKSQGYLNNTAAIDGGTF